MSNHFRVLSSIAGALAIFAPRVLAGDIVLPSTALERDSVIAAKYRLTSAVTGPGRLTVHWTDVLGRVVEDRTIPFVLTDETEVYFPLDIRRAVAMKNRLEVHASIQGKNQKAEADNREEDAALDFVAKPLDRGWHDYQIIMWQPYPKEAYPVLRRLGITGGQYSGRAAGLPEALLANDMRWYSENIGTDYYSEYHRYRSDRIQHWSFLQAKDLLRKDPDSKEAFKRHPSFWDPVWRARIQERLVEAVKRNSPYRPFFYSLADESGIADLAAFWDFDFSDQSLVPMRRWLQDRYATLATLNTEWGSSFPTWDLVTPPTTHEAMQRKDGNFAAWADFKEWMDVTFADALQMGRNAVESIDPHAYVNIGGGQRPGWGGYDYARITQALTAIEPYDIGNNVEIIRSLNPKMAMVSTGFANGPWEQQRVWRELFHGHRGLIIWDEKHEYAGANGQPGARGIEAAKYYNEIRDGSGALIINSQPVTDPIAIHYSQASMRTEWMLARRSEGDRWIDRGAKVERTDDEFLRLRESWCELIEDQGLQYNFVSYSQMEKGELLKGGYRVLVLPRSSSLSAAEVTAIRGFVVQGGVAIADGDPGTFNEHSRRLTASPLADLFGEAHDQAVTVHNFGKGKAIFLKAATLDYLQDRLSGKEGPVHKLIGDLFRANNISPEFAVTDSAGNPVVGLETHVFRNGETRIVTLLSNPLLRVDELGPPDFRSNKRFEAPANVKLKLPAPMYVYDSRMGKPLGQKQSLNVTVGPYEPLIFTLSRDPLPKLDTFAPRGARLGSLVEIGISVGATPAETHIFHVDIFDPKGTRVPHYTENLIANRGHARKLLPLALNDPAGEWKIRIRDGFTGETRELALAVN
ncbi:MAG: beta-galactosidase [Acidobacteriota bacterium]|nr:beta-galactosidase [Acidobacteriota bacterium]